MDTHSPAHVMVEPTPNPDALKFVVDRVVKTNGKSTFKKASECHDVPLALALFTIRGVDQIHFFQNVITISKFSFEEWDTLEPRAVEIIEEKIKGHNPDFLDIDPEVERRKNLSPDLLKIEEILDRRIRPGLQGDGGDLQALSYKEDVLIIKYQGACGTCPSSATGTLEAIKQILRDEFNPEIEVYTAPSEF